MQINIRFSGLWLFAVVFVIGGGWFFYDQFFPRVTTRAETAVVAFEKPVVMRTQGGLLEIATVKAYERFTRSDTKEFWGIPLGTTVSQIQVAVTYRYHIEMAKEWTLSIKDKTCVVRAGMVKPTLPVAFDTTTLQKFTQSGWARFDKDENLAMLERSLTPELQKRSQSEQFRQMAADAGKLTIAEFVTKWLLKEQQWKRDPEYKVVVLYPGETMPTQSPVAK